LQKIRFVSSNARFSLMLLFTQYKTVWLTAFSSHCLVALPYQYVCIQQSHAQNAHCRHLRSTFEDLLPAYCYAIKANSRTVCSHISPLASAGRVANLPLLKPDFEILPFVEHLAFFGNQDKI